jgi:hypothetical protein
MNRMIVLTSILCATTNVASADGPYLSVTPGIAGAAATTHTEGNDYTLKGGGGRIGVAAGWSVTPNLVVFAELLGHGIMGPDLDVSGDVHKTDKDVGWGIGYLGAGAKLFFGPNVHFSASAGVLNMAIDAPDMPMAKTDLGFGVQLGLGKDWLVSPRWGLGAALEVLGGSVPDGNVRWNVATVGIAMSATYH